MSLEIIIIIVFVLGYLGIAFEHSLKIDKLIPALIMMAVMWGIISYFDMTVFEIDTKNKDLIPYKLKSVMKIKPRLFKQITPYQCKGIKAFIIKLSNN